MPIDMVGFGFFYFRRSMLVYASIVAALGLWLTACGPNQMVSKKKNGTTTGSSTCGDLCDSRYSGSLDTSFYSQTAPSTSGVNARIKKTVASTDGKFYALGEITVSGKLQFMIEKHLSDGSLDTTLGNGGRVISNVGGSDTQCSERRGPGDVLTNIPVSQVKAIEASELLLGADSLMIAATLEVDYDGAGPQVARKRFALLTYNGSGNFVSCNTYSAKLATIDDNAALFYDRDAYVKAAAIDSAQRVFLVGVVGLQGVSQSQLSDFSQASKLYPKKWQLGVVEIRTSNGVYDSSQAWNVFLADDTNDSSSRLRDFFPAGAAVSGSQSTNNSRLMVGATKFSTSGSSYVTQLATARFDINTSIKPDFTYKVTGDLSTGGAVVYTSTNGYLARTFKQKDSGSYFFAGEVPSQSDGSYFVIRLASDSTTIDSTFGNLGGVFKSKLGSYNNRANAIYFETVASSVQPKVVVAVDVAQSNLGGSSLSDTYALDDLREKKLMLVRLNSNGTVDTSFGSTLSTSGAVTVDFSKIGLTADQISQSSGFSVFGDSTGYVVGGQIRLKSSSTTVNSLLIRVVR